ncbi:MAG: hypothetical protein Fur003_0310 [Candidatus Dojkabacteria bacterium]
MPKAKKTSKTEPEMKPLARALPQIVQEVAQSAPAPLAAGATTPVEVQISETVRRTKDALNLEENISEYLKGIVKLRNGYANRLYALLVFEVVSMFAIVILFGLGYLKLESWLVTIVAESILVKSFLSVQTIVSNLFPNKSLLETIVDTNGK